MRGILGKAWREWCRAYVCASGSGRHILPDACLILPGVGFVPKHGQRTGALELTPITP
ncbi:hypothetical protein EMIT0P4_100112 [Pseudomonas sp. IT-P4]